MLKHAKTCQDTTCQTYTRKQKSNMSVDLLKPGRMLKHATTCQDTTCQTYTRKKKANKSVDLQKQGQKFATARAHAQTCQIMSGDHLSNIYESADPLLLLRGSAPRSLLLSRFLPKARRATAARLFRKCSAKGFGR